MTEHDDDNDNGIFERLEGYTRLSKQLEEQAAEEEAANAKDFKKVRELFAHVVKPNKRRGHLPT